LPANHIIMGKKNLTKKGMCEVLADKLHQENLTEKEIYNILIGLWTTAFNEGWYKRLSESKYFKELERNRLKKAWDKQRDAMEDIIHGGIKPKAK